MINRRMQHDDSISQHDRLNIPRATAAEKITYGMRPENLIGRWPGDVDDGFEEAIRELRRGCRDPAP
jgi:hypothetical protein